MTKFLFTLVAVLSLVLVHAPLTQAKSAAIAGAGCLTENATLTVTLNDTESDISVIKTKFDQKIADVQQASKEAALDKFFIQSVNYSISPQNSNGDKQYILNGSVGFRVEPAGKAIELLSLLTKKGYTATINVNSYNNGTNANCLNQLAPAPGGE